MSARASVTRLLRPESIAIVGASERIGPGLNAWRALERVGFAGRVYLVNPSRPSLFGRATFPELAAIPDPIDAVFIAVPRDAVVDALRQAAAKGARGAAVLSSGFAEAGPDGIVAERELAAVATAHGIAVCGPNCLGLISLAANAALFGTSLPTELARGGVAAIVQSGSVGIALLNAARGLGLSHLITSGNEAVTTAADYLDVLVDEPGVTAVIAFLEQLRMPREFVAAARRARALGKPVIVVKSGRSERGRQAVMAHTGAVAGSDEVCDAAFDAAGVIRVRSLDELLETATLVSTSRRRPTAPGVALLSASGGEIALALDIAEATGLELPALPDAAAQLTTILPDFAHPGNPLDLTWSGLYDPMIARRCAETLGAPDEIGTVVLLQDAPRGLGEQQATRYANLLAAVADGADAVGKPLAVVSNLAGECHPAFDAVARQAAVPCLRGTEEGLAAVARFARWASAPRDLSAETTPQAERDAAARLVARFAATRQPAEHEARQILASYGIREPREHVARDADEAVRAAESLGYPVVLKGIVDGIAHKTEAGLVVLRVESGERVRSSAAELARRAQRIGGDGLAGILVQEMVAPVAELLVGARVDPEFGPVIVVGGGGILVEVYRDVTVRLAPVHESVAREMIARTRSAVVLGGWRGRPRGDVDGAARAVAALSRFIADFADTIREAEINPLAVLAAGDGVVMLDALVVPVAPR